jgi:hypothetical protein
MPRLADRDAVRPCRTAAKATGSPFATAVRGAERREPLVDYGGRIFIFATPPTRSLRNE